jgi:hypothetical protein
MWHQTVMNWNCYIDKVKLENGENWSEIKRASHLLEQFQVLNQSSYNVNSACNVCKRIGLFLIFNYVSKTQKLLQDIQLYEIIMKKVDEASSYGHYFGHLFGMEQSSVTLFEELIQDDCCCGYLEN